MFAAKIISGFAGHPDKDLVIAVMQNFVENFSEFSAAQRNAGKHVTIMSELSRLVDARTLMQVLQHAARLCFVVMGHLTVHVQKAGVHMPVHCVASRFQKQCNC